MTADASAAVTSDPLALEAQVRVQRGKFLLDAAVEVAAGEVLAVLGPNGSGKSTLLATLAGLIVPDEGRIAVGGRPLTRTPATTGSPVVAVPPSERGVGLLGQDPLLFPHLTVEANVAFGQQSQGKRKTQALRDARKWLASVGLAGFGSRRPHELSGGQQQRVAIARALAARPGLLLLDEPMGALDVQTAVVIRQLLRQQLSQRDTSAIIVTHDVVDALVLADRIAILHDGRVVDEGAVTRVLGRPRNAFIAALAGVNLVEGTATVDGVLETDDGRRFRGDVPTQTGAGVQLAAAFSPRAVSLAQDGAAGTRRANHWRTRVTDLGTSTGGIRLVAGDISADVSAAQIAERGIQPGDEVWLRVDSADVSVWTR